MPRAARGAQLGPPRGRGGSGRAGDWMTGTGGACGTGVGSGSSHSSFTGIVDPGRGGAGFFGAAGLPAPFEGGPGFLLLIPIDATSKRASRRALRALPPRPSPWDPAVPRSVLALRRPGVAFCRASGRRSPRRRGAGPASTAATMSRLWMRCIGAAVSVALGSPLVACGGSPSSEPRLGVTNSQPRPKANDAVVERLAAARCDQEQRCGNVRPGALFASRQDCLVQLRGSIGDDLESYDCVSGLDRPGLGACARALAGDRCGEPFQTLARYGACRHAASCLP